jgi:hypothetical protein
MDLLEAGTGLHDRRVDRHGRSRATNASTASWVILATLLPPPRSYIAVFLSLSSTGGIIRTEALGHHRKHYAI